MDRDQMCRATCRAAGVLFIGIQATYGTKPHDLLLFQPNHGICKGTTLAVPVTATPSDIGYRIEEAVSVARSQAA